MTLAPVVLFVYNRLWHTQQTVEALQKNKLASQSKLYIYSDGAKNEGAKNEVEKVREYIKKIDGFSEVEIIEREHNYGLADSIIDGVTKVVKNHGKVIVLEDDLVSSPFFLQYMNDGLEMYKDENKVACIHGYTYPMEGLERTFFIRGTDCWGWGTWDRAWDVFEKDGQKLLKGLEDKELTNEFDFNNSYPYTKMLSDQIIGKNDSWAIRWKAAAFLKDMVTLYNLESHIQNIGNDDSGTHNESTDDYNVKLAGSYYKLNKIAIKENVEMRGKMGSFYNSIKPSFKDKVKAKIKSMLK